MNDTFKKFGWPRTRIAESDHWAVMLRPEQPTLGALVLACKEPVQSYGEVSAEGHADLGRTVKAIETMLTGAIDYDKINYLMLMMVDPDVHFHVLPRYKTPRAFSGMKVADAGWPGPPALDKAISPDAGQSIELIDHLRSFWPA